MTLEEFEQKLYEKGWRYFCWSDSWYKDDNSIYYPNEKYLDKNQLKNINEIKIVLKNKNNEEKVLTENDLNDL